MGAFTPAKLDRAGEAVTKVMEAAPDGMVVIGPDGRIIRVNTQAEELFGYSQDQLLGQKLDLLIPPRRPRPIRRGSRVTFRTRRFVRQFMIWKCWPAGGMARRFPRKSVSAL